MEQIGLQAVFEDKDYQAGVKRYVQGNKTAEKSTSSLAEEMKTASTIMTGVSSAIHVAQQAVMYLEKAYNATAGAAIEFNGKIEETMRLTGESAEETSRLVIAMGNLGIGQEKMATIFEAATKKGISLNTESIKNLADQYVSLNAGFDRTKFLLDNFGKSGTELAEFFELGSAGVEKLMMSVSETSLATQESIDNAQELSRSWNKLSEKAKMVGVTIGNAVVPSLEAWVDKINEYIDAAQKAAADSESQRKDIIETADSYKEAKEQLIKWAEAQNSNQQYGDAMAKSLVETDYYMKDYIETHSQATDIIGKFTEASNARNESELAAIAAYQRWSTMGEPVDITPMLQAEKEAADLVTASFGELTKQQLFNMAAANLDSKAQLQLALDLGILNMDTYNQLTVMGKLDDAYQNGKISTEEYMQGVKNLGYAIDLLKDKTVHVNVVVSQTGGYTGLGYNEDRNRAAGGPVQPGKSYWVGEAGRELFTPTMPGYVTSNHNVTNTYNNSYNMPVYTSQAQNVVQRSFGIARLLAQ